MKMLAEFARELAKDESGASFLEYTVLIGVTLAISLATLVAIGEWSNGRWSLLNSTVNP